MDHILNEARMQFFVDHLAQAAVDGAPPALFENMPPQFKQRVDEAIRVLKDHRKPSN
jgi:hypothetical protein